jgi:NhaP-type Na+/H+ or K+/H+ antiporter
MTPEKFNPPAAARTRVPLVILQYLGSYLLGILTCVLFTPVDLVLAGKALWPFYPFAVIGFFLYYFYLDPQYVFGPATTYWLVGSIGLAPLVFEVAAYFRRSPRLRAWRPLWIGFPLGFIGTLGVFYTAAASI